MVGSTSNSPARPSSTFAHLPNTSNHSNLLNTRHPVDIAETWKGWNNGGGGNVETKFKEPETKFKELETKFKELETKFEELVTKFKELVTKFKELETKFKELELELHNWINEPDSQLKESGWKLVVPGRCRELDHWRKEQDHHRAEGRQSIGGY